MTPVDDDWLVDDMIAVGCRENGNLVACKPGFSDLGLKPIFTTVLLYQVIIFDSAAGLKAEVGV